LAEGHWQPVVGDPVAEKETKQIYRLVLCSGKVYADLVSSESRESNHAVAIARVEQLYPFPEDEISSVIKKYGALKEIVWVQEEPENMGAWTFVQPRLNRILNGRLPLRYIGRPANSSPAEGSMARHAAVQRQLVGEALVEIGD
jgi:2-oxoglutarate dehydrogenase E1 component